MLYYLKAAVLQTFNDITMESLKPCKFGGQIASLKYLMYLKHKEKYTLVIMHFPTEIKSIKRPK